MADIQPKNTDTIRVNTIKEKTGGSKITLDNITLVNEVKEKTASNGVRLNDIVKFTTALIPLSATIDIGTSTAAEHVREAFLKKISSNGQSLTISVTSAHDIDLQSTNLTRVSVLAAGDLSQNATNGGNLVWANKQSTAITQTATTSITAAGTIITDATDLTAVFNHVTTAAASTGVQLWDAPIGSTITVVNSGANALNVWPHSAAGTFNGGSAGSAVAVATNTYNVFVRVSSTNWIAREIASAAA